MQRDLVERARAGDQEAFSELIRLWFDRLYAIARLILRDTERAEDATQEALVAAWRDLRGLRDPDRFDSWVRQLLVRECYREARREREQQRLVLNVGALDGVVSDASMELADRDELERGFRRLAPDQRALIVLHFYLDLPINETAEVLGIPSGTVKSRLNRTMQALRASLEAEARAPVLIEGRSA
jgi:RNA polymerase sigma factor (sigma-70 family)